MSRSDSTPTLLPPSSDWPDWYTPSSARRAANLRVLRGLHPFGFALGPEGSTCGTCEHLYRRQYASVYWKCRLAMRAGGGTGGPSTDVVKRWRGCDRWETSCESEAKKVAR
jgi:hypothetical protein